MTSNGAETPSIGERLQRAGITEVVVIDNTFDKPTLSDLFERDIDVFWGVVRGNTDLQEELEAMGIDSSEHVEDIDARDEMAFAKLWEKGEDGSEIAKAAKENLFGIILEDRDKTNSIVQLLEKLELNVTTFGTELTPPPSPVKLVFLDYYLGPIRDSVSTNRASTVARSIYSQYGDPNEKPFLVLMSSLHDVRDKADTFRSDSGLLGGLFDFVTKDDLLDQTMLAIKLASWAAGMPDRHHIQSFVEALESSLAGKAREFMEEVKSLTFDDYAFIQSLSLEKEGQPLGDYMISLFGSLLMNSVLEDNDALAGSRTLLDKMSFTAFVPSQRAPSNHLARIYSLSVSEPIPDESTVHPLESSKGEDWLPRLRLGDIWIKDTESEVYMVANPDCDLAFGPGGRRKIDKDLSVLLIPGHLVALDRNAVGEEIRTDLFQIDDQKFRIDWDPKKTVTVRIDRFRELYSDGEYSRRKRLRLPHALRIQHAFTSHVSQVGVPVSPPLYERVNMQFYAEGETTGWEELEEPVENGAAIIYTSRNEGSVVITNECVERLLKMMPTVIGRYREKREAADSETRIQRLDKKLAELESCMDDPRHLLAILEKTWDVPGVGETTDLKSTVVRLHNRRTLGTHCSDHYICLDILHPPT